MGLFLVWYVKLLVVIEPLGLQVTPPTPNDGAASSFPIKFDEFFGALLSIAMKLGAGIGTVMFVFALVGAIKERPVRWSAVIMDGVSIVALLVLVFKSGEVITWVANLI